MIFTKRFSILISLMLITTASFAGDTPVAHTPDISNGKTIAAGTCSACHGADGNSMIPMYPSLAGQHAAYLTKQLSEFKSGARANAVMGPMATMLSDTDMADVSAFYASQKATLKNPSAGDIKTGKLLYFVGDSERGIPACAGCHSNNGKGIIGKYPSIAGQSGDYVISQLKLFKTGQRENDANKMMRTVAKRLSEDDMKALADFTSNLR